MHRTELELVVGKWIIKCYKTFQVSRKLLVTKADEERAEARTQVAEAWVWKLCEKEFISDLYLQSHKNLVHKIILWIDVRKFNIDITFAARTSERGKWLFCVISLLGLLVVFKEGERHPRWNSCTDFQAEGVPVWARNGVVDNVMILCFILLINYALNIYHKNSVGRFHSFSLSLPFEIV